MRAFGVPDINYGRFALGLILVMAFVSRSCPALDKPTGAPLILSSIETEQPVPLAFLDPDGKTAHCAAVKLHWNPNPAVGPGDDATSFEIDLPSDNPGASIFTAQLWSASLASALAWQQPWQGARWKVLVVPPTDGTGIDAALAVGMIATSARRPYPDKTVVIGSLNPDGSLGPVSRLLERLDSAAAAGMTRVIIPNVQRFDTDPSGQVVNMARHAEDLHLECVPVDNLAEATETVMNDPLPAPATGSSGTKYSHEVAAYLEGFARHEESEMAANLDFAPKEGELNNYPPRLAALWKSVYADAAAGQQAYHAGQVYVAYRLFSHADASMSGANSLSTQSPASFDVKATLAESDDLRNHLHDLMNPPAIDRDELQSAVLVAEMADWAYEIDASLEGAQLVTKQTFSQRSDATEAEKDRAREAILFAIEQGKYLLGQANFFSGLLAHLGSDNPVPVDENAAHLLPQLIPAQLATARVFTDGIRQRASDLRDGLLFDPQLVAYVNVLRETKAYWDARQRKKDIEAQAAATESTPATNAPTEEAVKPSGNATTEAVGFDPGQTYRPPHTVLAPTLPQKKISDAALCLIWANNDCEIATLDQKYLRLSGILNPATHEWHVKDRPKLDALLQSAEAGARQGIAFAEKAEIDPSVLDMIYERASCLRNQEDDASALEALRNYWRCALIGNMCWQLAHTRKAEAVEVVNTPAPAPGAKTPKTDGKPGVPAVTENKAPETSNPRNAVTNTMTVVNPPKNTGPVVTPPASPTPGTVNPANLPVPPVASVASTNSTSTPAPPRALPVTAEELATNSPPTSEPPPAVEPPLTSTPVASAIDDTNNEPNIPVAPIAKIEDYTGTNATNAAPVNGPPAPSHSHDNADSHGAAF